MPDQPRPRESRRRVDVIAAAADLVDADGFEALSMRRLAARLGVTPMALYNHVTDKHDLIAGVVDHVLSAIEPPGPDAPWRSRLRAVFTSLRQLYLDHPNIVPVIQSSATVSAAQLAPMEAALDALVEAGLPISRARESWVALISLTNGLVAYELQGHLASTDPSVTSAIEDAGTFPRISAALATDAPLDYDAVFATALDALIHGLTRRSAEPHAGLVGLSCRPTPA